MKNSTTKSNEKKAVDVYQIVTDRVIAEMEKGIIPWKRPWTVAPAISRLTGKPYSLLNQFLLTKPGEFLTWNQITKEGGKIKEGAKRYLVTFWKSLEKDMTDKTTGEVITDANGEALKEEIPCLRYYYVYSIDDVEGIEPKIKKTAPESTAKVVLKDLKKEADAFGVMYNYLDREKITLDQQRSNRAYYSPCEDLIRLPLPAQFESRAAYFSTAFHEMTHSTGHASRLNRKGITALAAFGSATYSKEELVAEMGSACLLSRVGMEIPETFQNHVAYLQNWIAALKNDKRLLVTAAQLAEKATRFILGEGKETMEA